MRHHASTVYAIVMCLSVCLSVTSQCSTEMAKHRITQTTPHYSPGTLVFWRWRSRQNSNGVIPCGSAKWRWDSFNWWLSTNYFLQLVAIVNLVRSWVYHTERPRLFAAHFPWCSALCGFISDSWYLLFCAAGCLWQILKTMSIQQSSMCEFVNLVPAVCGPQNCKNRPSLFGGLV